MNIGRFVLTSALATLLVTACKSKLPAIVSLTGPTTGPTRDTLAFQAKGEDPKGRDLSYEIDWDDTSSLAWTAPYPSGKQVTLLHVYNDTGLFHVRAKTRSGSEAESEWSEPFAVRLSDEPPAKPVVSATPSDQGEALELSWSPVRRADNYRVTIDGSATMTTDTFFFVQGPARQISVCAYSKTTKGEESSIDCTPAVTDVVVYGCSDPDSTHPYAFGFTTDGTCTAYTLVDQNKPYVDFVVDDQNIYPIGLINSGDYSWPQNHKVNTSKYAGTSSFDDLDTAASSGYCTQTRIETGLVYTLWLSDSTNWNPCDHFCKTKVASIEQVAGSRKVTLKVGYQRVGGLRWLKTN